MADKSSFGNPGNGIRSNSRCRRYGADPPKKESGTTGADLSDVRSCRFDIPGNGFCIAAETLSNCQLASSQSFIVHMRLPRPSTAMMLSMLDTEDMEPRMRRHRSGQTSSVSIARVPGVQARCRFKRHGDPKTTFRHRRHTCVSDSHASVPFLVATCENGVCALFR